MATGNPFGPFHISSRWARHVASGDAHGDMKVCLLRRKPWWGVQGLARMRYDKMVNLNATWTGTIVTNVVYIKTIGSYNYYVTRIYATSADFIAAGFVPSNYISVDYGGGEVVYYYIAPECSTLTYMGYDSGDAWGLCGKGWPQPVTTTSILLAPVHMQTWPLGGSSYGVYTYPWYNSPRTATITALDELPAGNGYLQASLVTRGSGGVEFGSSATELDDIDAAGTIDGGYPLRYEVTATGGDIGPIGGIVLVNSGGDNVVIGHAHTCAYNNGTTLWEPSNMIIKNGMKLQIDNIRSMIF